MRTAYLSLLLLAVSLAPFDAVAMAENGNAQVRYVVRKGDTLINVADRYLVRAESYKIVQHQNRIADPRTIPVGKILMIPRDLLKFKLATARLVAVRGRVLAEQEQAVVGQVLNEGTTLSTAEASFATLLLTDGSRISLPSNSDVRIRLLRSYLLGGSLDYDFDVVKGGMRSSVMKHKSNDDRYRVRTPKAVSAVRGTDFQSRFDPATKGDFAEVTEGALAVDVGTAKPSDLLAGNGVAVAANGAVIRELLLAPPELVEPGKLQADPVVRFVAKPVVGVTGYRITLATDAGFVDQVADRKIIGEHAEFDDIGNGRYFIRVRALSPNGFEGMPVTYAFKRSLNGVNASAGQSDEGFAFKWLGDGDGIRRHRFQLFRGSPGSLPMVDESSLDGDRIILSDLPPGDYFWRVGAVQYLGGEMTVNWTALEKMTVSQP